MVVRVTAIQGCTDRPLLTHCREHTVRRTASAAATILEAGILIAGVVMIGAGVANANKADSDAKEHPEHCTGETSCSTLSGTLLATLGVLVTAVAIPVLVVDSTRQSESVEPSSASIEICVSSHEFTPLALSVL